MVGLRSIAAVAALAMPVLAMTPEEMLAAPRRSEAIPNPSGELAAFTSTNYSWETHKSQTVWNLLNLTSGEVSLLFNGSDISEMVWIGETDTSVIYVNGTNEEEDGGISLYSADVTAIDNATLIASLPAPYAGLKAVKTEGGDIRFLMYSQAYLNGSAYNADLVEEPLSTARIYTSTYVRHWDTWLTDKKNNVFSGTLTSGDGGYSFDGNLTNLMVGLSNVSRAESPVMPFGGSSDYDLSPDGSTVAFLTKNIDLSLANYTSSQIWIVPFSGESKPQVLNGLGAASTPAGAEGASAGPVFSPDGSKIAYMQMDGINYESDKNKIYVANPDPANPEIQVLIEDWDVSPSALKWSSNSTGLFLDAPHRGNDRMFEMIPLDAPAGFEPKNITNRGTVAAFFVLPNDNLLVSDSKMWSARDVYIIDPEGAVVADLFHANLVDAGYEGMDESIQSEFYFKGNFTDVQAFLVFPQSFDPSKKYPLAFIIHGGPQVQHSNSFSTRWNFKVWADQGYVVVAPNPTGSNGFGQAFEDAIQNNWGGSPYDDLVKCWNYVKENFDYIDTDNGIAAGASYGGYMTNWVQGHDLGREFKALVTHDGSTDTGAQYTSEELWFMEHDFNGTLWDNPENYEIWNPINHIKNWATPQFVVHNTLDYRLPESEGIMLFNILQSRGVPSKLLNFPDENHWVLNRENSIVWHTQIFEWINWYTGLSDKSPFEGPYPN